MPLAPNTFRQSKISAQTIAAVREMLPGTLYVTKTAANKNMLAYVAAPIREVGLKNIEDLEVPALAILAASEMSEPTARKHDFRAMHTPPE